MTTALKTPTLKTTPLQKMMRCLTLATVLFSLVAVVWQPSSVQAHAQLVSVSPANGTVLIKAPSSISIAFNEVVGTSSSRLQLLDSQGKVVSTTFALQENGTKYKLTPKKKLLKGTYALRYSVTSADGHIIVGASSFGIGSKSSTATKSVPLKAGTKALSVQIGSTVGQVRLTHSLSAVTLLELRHSMLKAPMEVSVTQEQLVVLPFAGKWTISLHQSVSPYQEVTYSGYITVKGSSK